MPQRRPQFGRRGLRRTCFRAFPRRLGAPAYFGKSPRRPGGGSDFASPVSETVRVFEIGQFGETRPAITVLVDGKLGREAAHERNRAAVLDDLARRLG